VRVGVLARLLRTPHLLAQGLVLHDLQTFVRVDFLYAAASSGLLIALKRPASMEELVRELGVKRVDLLEALLAVGVALGELSFRQGRYRLRGARSKAFADRRSDPLVAVVEEYATYHGSVYQELAARMRGAPSGDYLEGTGELIARSSRALEPIIIDFVRALTAKRGPLRVLEVGCGSGIYLRHAAKANPLVWGTGIDMQADVVEQAKRNMSRWGLGGRFEVILADIRQPPVELSGPFDLITMYNNIYYFTPEERPPLFRSLRERLSDGGRVAIVSAMRGSSVATNDFDLVLRSTAGCTALPRPEELRAQLLGSGFDGVISSRLVPFESYYGLVAIHKS
jgi:SAM-dependent methyltransferase